MWLGLAAPAGAQSGAQAQADVKLPEVKVTGRADTPQDGYRATQTRTTRQLQDPQDIPQAITTVTRSLMTEQQVGSVRDALRNVSGLTFNAAEGGRSGDNMMLRGFYTFGDIYLDGIRDTAQYNRETFNLEQIDVLRGSAAMLFGRGQAGGVINLVSKTPFLSDRHSLSASVGTQGYNQVLGDFNKRLGENTALRVNVMNRGEGSRRVNPANGDDAQLNRDGLAASLGLGIGTRHEFTLSHQVTRTRDRPDYGVSFDGNTKRINTNFPATAWWGSAANFDDSETTLSTLAHTFRINRDTQLRTQLRSGHYDRAYWVKTPNVTAAPSATGATGGNVTRSGNYKTLTLQSDLTTRAVWFGMRHQLLAGLEVMNEQGRRTSLANLGSASAPVYLRDALNPTAAPATFKGDTRALYVQDSIEFVPNWRLVLGMRHDQLSADYSSLTSPKLSFSQNSYRAGLSWQPSEDAHYYLSMSDSFSPTADLYQLSGGAYPAERSKVLELGAKWLFMDGDLAFRTALYRADKDWERNTDLESTAAILTRKRRTNGLEFEMAGRITPKWEVFWGLALQDSKILQVAENRNAATGAVTVSDARLKGQTARNTPPFTFNLWTTYQLPAGFKVGMGLETKGRRFVYQPSTANADAIFTPSGAFNPNTAPAYVRYDAMLTYERKDWTLRLNLQNLFDKVYYDSLYDNGGFGVPGTRRRAMLTATTRF
ncbi:MAG: TonB-dependent receptor [Burkholderiaceae bacterium]|nr:TonB-dependent receptor [Burkholderiaceae bacterium]